MMGTPTPCQKKIGPKMFRKGKTSVAPPPPPGIILRTLLMVSITLLRRLAWQICLLRAFGRKTAIGNILPIFNSVILNVELFHCSATLSK